MGPLVWLCALKDCLFCVHCAMGVEVKRYDSCGVGMSIWLPWGEVEGFQAWRCMVCRHDQ